MSRTNTYIRLLLGGHLSIAVLMAIGGNIVPMGRPPVVFTVLLIGVFLAQAVSAGLWTGLSNRSAPSRFARGFVAAGLIWGFAFASCYSWTPAHAWISLLLWVAVPWVAVAIAASLLRRFGIQCAAIETEPAEPQAEGIQFSLRQLAIAIATCAVLLSVVRGLRSASSALTIASFFLTAGAFAIAFTLQALACLWATLGVRRWASRIWLPLLLALAWAMLMVFAFGGHLWRPEQYAHLLAIELLCTSVTLASLLAVRFAGYRIVRNPALYLASSIRLETEIA
jgi:hypothetical protein